MKTFDSMVILKLVRIYTCTVSNHCAKYQHPPSKIKEREIGGVLWLSDKIVWPHLRHCVVSLSKTFYPLLSTGSTQEDPSRLD